MVLGGCFTFWIPETAGKSLEEILQERECNLSLSDKRVEENARGWRIVSLGWPLSLIHRHSTSPERNDEDYFELDEDF